MATTTQRRSNDTYRAKVSARHTITLPADVLRQLQIAPGDAVEIMVEGQHARLSKAESPARKGLVGLLSDYFVDQEDVRRFIEVERSGWKE